ncbi:hypothetical protein [Pseudomonas sp. C9-3]|uniref:hypothetical protein n=1 Tax=Pseudomonas sp. C9-3 TaxID=3078264 RepID=UPI0028E8B7A2|nr:hypothetical protein [Pseudomonas sp. C9-3]
MLLPTPKEMRPGGSLDLGTLKGCVRCFFLGWICFFCLWYADDFFLWVDQVRGIVRNYPPYKDQRFHRFLAISLSGAVIVSSFVIGITIYIKRESSRKAARGQWYDKENLTREDLYGDKEKLEESAESPDDRPPH